MSRGYVKRVANTRRDNLGLESISLKDFDDVRNQAHAVLADIVEPADEWTDERRPSKRS
jgi:hypothetical protein